MKKRNRKMSKALLVVCCALALVIIGVGATIAYLTDTESVTNTFTAGQVTITLTESDVYEVGENIPVGKKHGEAIDGADRVRENDYHLIPGYTYTKDPTVFVDEASEDCYVFVKVENGIAGIEADDNKIAAQITDNGWTKLGAQDDNVYWQLSKKSYDDRDLEVFESFKIDGKHDGAELEKYKEAKVTVTAYAIQAEGFANAEAAWNAGNKPAGEGGWIVTTTTP